MCLAFLLLVAGLIVVINRTRLGRVLRGISDSPTALSTSGLGVNVTRVLVFTISGFLAAVSGVLYGSGVLTASTVDISSSRSRRSCWSACSPSPPSGSPGTRCSGSLPLLIPGYVTGDTTIYSMNTLFGLSAIAVAARADAADPPRLRVFSTAWAATAARDGVRTPIAPASRVGSTLASSRG